MTWVQVCDLVYVHLLDQLREQSRDAQTHFVIARSNGAEVDPPPSYDQAIERFEELLAAPFVAVDDPQRELREALGLTGR